MGSAKAVTIVGFKDSGKTRVVEAIVKELISRGHKVGTLKHTIENGPLDVVGTDTYRHSEAGAVATGIISSSKSAVFYKRALTITKTIDLLGELDYIILEGFKSIDTVSRIIVPREIEDVKSLSNGLEIATVDINGILQANSQDSTFKMDELVDLVDIVEQKSYPVLAGLNCKGCGYPSCRDLGQAILRGEGNSKLCVKYSSNLLLHVNGFSIPLNPFMQSTFINVILALTKNLKEIEAPQKVEIEFQVN